MAEETAQRKPISEDERRKNRKQLILLAGTIVVAVMFISSYAAFGGNGGQSTTTTSVAQSTLPVFGNANAVVTGYASSLTVSLNDKNASGAVNKTLSELESNGSINDYIQEPSSFIIYAANENPYQIQQLFLSRLPGNSISINSTEKVAIPAILTLYYYGRPVSVYTPVSNFTLSSSLLSPIGSNVVVSVQALVTQAGQLYGDNIQVSAA